MSICVDITEDALGLTSIGMYAVTEDFVVTLGIGGAFPKGVSPFIVANPSATFCMEGLPSVPLFVTVIGMRSTLPLQTPIMLAVIWKFGGGGMGAGPLVPNANTTGNI